LLAQRRRRRRRRFAATSGDENGERGPDRDGWRAHRITSLAEQESELMSNSPPV
jgi:hypothetical protein